MNDKSRDGEHLLSASIADTAGAKAVAWRYDTQQGFSYHAQQLDHFYTGWDGEYVKGEPLYATPVDAEREKNEIIQALQKALFYWMPSIAGEDSPAGQKAAEHAYLLFGLNDNSVECYGDQIRAYVGIMNRQQEKLEIVLRDAGFEDGEDHIEFIEKLASRATPPAIAAHPAPSVADAAEPIYQVKEKTGAWIDLTREEYETMPKFLRRIVFTAAPCSVAETDEELIGLLKDCRVWVGVCPLKFDSTIEKLVARIDAAIAKESGND